MLEPKTFYRKLDALLSSIDKTKSGKFIPQSILKELEKTFNIHLNIANGRIYERVEEDFQLIHSTYSNNYTEFIPIISDEIQKVLTNKLFIFDNGNDKLIKNRSESLPSAAITIYNPESRWIFVFDLLEGWVREEIEFCFNAVRTATNQKLFSDSFKNELEQSVHIQQSLLPTEMPEFNNFDIYAKSVAAELVGGDMYDFHKFDDNELAFCVGDASGHGISSALMVRDVVTGLRMGIEKHQKIVYTIQKLNNVIYRSVFASRFVSLFFGELESNGNLFYCNAGHPAPLLFTDNDIVELESTGIVLGALSEMELRRAFVNMKKNNILLLYTDGIVEKTNSTGKEYGTDKMIEFIKNNRNLSSKDLVEGIFNDANKFGNNRKWKDDVTLMIIKNN